MSTALCSDAHVILYVGLDAKAAWLAVKIARAHKARVGYQNARVTGTTTNQRHYTVVAYGLPDKKLRALYEECWP